MLDQLALSERGAEETIKAVGLPRDADPGTIQSYLPKIDSALKEWIYTLPSSANTTMSSSTAFSIITKLNVPPPFQDAWTKYGPLNLSLRDRQHIDQVIGISELNNLIEKRLHARKEKNFKESDRIRDELAAMGVTLKDSKEGTTWEIAR
jgi:cysteinyl-tRNA synthetase